MYVKMELFPYWIPQVHVHSGADLIVTANMLVMTRRFDGYDGADFKIVMRCGFITMAQIQLWWFRFSYDDADL